jgi:hypothetical protein
MPSLTTKKPIQAATAAIGSHAGSYSPLDDSRRCEAGRTRRQPAAASRALAFSVTSLMASLPQSQFTCGPRMSAMGEGGH